MPRSVRAAASGVLICAVVLGAAACGGDDGKPEATDPSAAASTSPSAAPSVAVSNAPGSQLSADPGLPSDFPIDEIPLLPGPVTQPLGAGSSGKEGRKGWMVEVRLDQKFEPCFEAAQEQLVARDFVKQPGEIKDASNWQAQFIGPEYAVILSTSPTDEGGCRLGYAVGQVHE